MSSSLVLAWSGQHLGCMETSYPYVRAAAEKENFLFVLGL